MKVSVILPFKNVETWVEETLDSILNQSHQDWELIAVDDHSSDNSFSIVEKYALLDERIFVFTNKSEGIIPALQLGISKAIGKYITRMDADDIMPNNRLDLFVNNLKNSNSKTIATGKVQYFGEQAISEGYRSYEHWLNDRVENQDHWKHIYRECVIASPNWIVQNSPEMTQIFSELVYPEDYDMCFRWYQAGYEIKSIPEITLQWREHPQRTSRNHENYQQQAFFNLKLSWFLQNERPQDKIALIGAGQKGKLTASYLIENNIDFNWYDLKSNKINSKILGKEILPVDEVNETKALVAVYPNPIGPLEKFLSEKQFTIGKNAWYL